MKRRVIFGTIVSGIIILATIMGACAPKAPEVAPPPEKEAPPPEKVEVQPIKVGVLGPMQFIFGEDMWNAAVLAEEEINEAGGVSVAGVKRPIELVKADSNEFMSVPDSIAAAEKLIMVDKVDVITGMFRSEAVLAVQDLCMDNKLIFFQAGAGGPPQIARVAEDYDRYKYFFRSGSINTGLYSYDLTLYHWTEVIRDELKDKAGIEKPKVAVLMEATLCTEPSYWSILRDEDRLGIDIVWKGRPSDRATDLTAELTPIKAAGAQMICTFFSGPAGIVLSKQWGELEIPAALYGMNMPDQDIDYWDKTGGMCNYEVGWWAFVPTPVSEKAAPFWEKFVARFDTGPSLGAHTYDAIMWYVKAVEKAGTVDADALIPVLEKTEYDGARGHFKFRTDHDPLYGPGYLFPFGVQFVNEEIRTVFPWEHKGATFPGTVKYELPPRVIEYWSKK